MSKTLDDVFQQCTRNTTSFYKTMESGKWVWKEATMPQLDKDLLKAQLRHMVDEVIGEDDVKVAPFADSNIDWVTYNQNMEERNILRRSLRHRADKLFGIDNITGQLGKMD